MDHAVALVQAYLQLNGYFTSAEYPILAGTSRSGFRAVTDIDILAFRFPTGEPMTGRGGRKMPKGLDVTMLDEGLAVPEQSIDMVIGEVKEGRVGINSGIRDPEVLQAVVSRFGEVPDVHGAVHQLLENGFVHIRPSSSVRLLAFGSFPPGSEVPPCRIISLGHVLLYLQNYVRKHWHILRHMQFKDPAFGFLMTLEKARRGAAGRRGEAGVEIVPSPQYDRVPNGRRAGESLQREPPPPRVRKRR